MQAFEELLLEAAETVDKQDTPASIALLKKTYDVLIEAGLIDDAIKDIMQLTSHQLRLIKKSVAKR